MLNRFVDEDLDWLVEEEETKTKGHFIQDPVTGLLMGSEPGPGDGDGGGSGPKAGIEGGAALHPEAINVGGDEWNKQTAVRLEKEFATAAPELEKIVSDAVSGKAEVEAEAEGPDPDNAPYVPEDWSTMSQDQQDYVENEYKGKTYDDYHQSEVDSWYENSALDDAASEVANKAGKDTFAPEWISDAIDKYRSEHDDLNIPFTNQQLFAALTVDYNGGYQDISKGLTIDFDTSALGLPAGWQEGQETLPGIAPQNPVDLLTAEMREGLIKDLEKAFAKEAESTMQSMDPPEYLDDSVKEFQEEQWGQMEDKEKFNWASANTNIIEDMQQEYDDYFGENKPGGETGTLDKLPNKFDPLEQNASAIDYQRTRQIAKHLSIERAANIMVERGLYGGAMPENPELKGVALENARADAKKMDRVLWEGWKGSSHGYEGQLLQKAVADELGGRLNPNMVTMSAKELEAQANLNAPYAGEGKSYDAVKAYVRGKWETTQYMLAKAGVNTVNIYRAVNIPDTAPPNVFRIGTTEARAVSAVKTFEKEQDAIAFINSQKGINPNGSFKLTNPYPDTHRVTATYRFDDEKQARAFADQWQKDPNNPAQHKEKVNIDIPMQGQEDSSIGLTYTRLPDIHVDRNGAASGSVDISVPNAWDGKDGRVVLRASVPRTAVVSVPAYGINVHSEHEVVVAGTAWKGWDAFYETAPVVERLKIGHQIAK